MIMKLYHPCTQFSHNVCLSHRRIVTFSAHHDFLIIVPYHYSYLLTEEFLTDKYLWQFYGKTPGVAKAHWKWHHSIRVQTNFY